MAARETMPAHEDVCPKQKLLYMDCKLLVPRGGIQHHHNFMCVNSPVQCTLECGTLLPRYVDISQFLEQLISRNNMIWFMRAEEHARSTFRNCIPAKQAAIEDQHNMQIGYFLVRVRNSHLRKRNLVDRWQRDVLNKENRSKEGIYMHPLRRPIQLKLAIGITPSKIIGFWRYAKYAIYDNFRFKFDLSFKKLS